MSPRARGFANLVLLLAIVIGLALISGVTYEMVSKPNTTSPPSIDSSRITPTTNRIDQSEGPYSWEPLAAIQNQPDYIYTAKDGHIFVSDPGGTPIEVSDADPASFLVAVTHNGMVTGFSKDDLHVYFFNAGDCCYLVQTVDGADPSTFEILSDEYARDKNTVYAFEETQLADGFFPSVLKGADSASFRLIPNNPTIDAQDKNHTYSAGIVVH